MDAFQLLKDDHKKVKALFKEYEGLDEHDHGSQQKIADQVFEELRIHTTLEEELFYPKLENKADEAQRNLVLEAYEEHRIVKELIDQLRDLETDDEIFQAKFKVLTENVRHHISEEEGDLFPKAKKILQDPEELGVEMEERKKELIARGNGKPTLHTAEMRR